MISSSENVNLTFKHHTQIFKAKSIKASSQDVSGRRKLNYRQLSCLWLALIFPSQFIYL